MWHFARRLLVGAAFAAAGGVSCAAELVRPGFAEDPGLLELEAEGAVIPALSLSVVPPAATAAPEAPPAAEVSALLQKAGVRRNLDRSPAALLRELYLADKDAGLDAFLVEMRGQALSGLYAPVTEAKSGCAGGRPCVPESAGRRPDRSVEDRELIATLASVRADVRDLVSPLQSIYQDSGLKTLLETARSDDLIFGQGRSSADATQDRVPGDAFGDGRNTPANRRDSNGEALALIRFIGEFWQIMRDFGIPLLLVLIMVRGVFWVAKARRA